MPVFRAHFANHSAREQLDFRQVTHERVHRLYGITGSICNDKGEVAPGLSLRSVYVKASLAQISRARLVWMRFRVSRAEIS
jgi:hypothetical protein